MTSFLGDILLQEDPAALLLQEDWAALLQLWALMLLVVVPVLASRPEQWGLEEGPCVNQ